VKTGVDPQEAALNKITHVDTQTGDPAWGQEWAANWGVLHIACDWSGEPE